MKAARSLDLVLALSFLLVKPSLQSPGLLDSILEGKKTYEQKNFEMLPILYPAKAGQI